MNELEKRAAYHRKRLNGLSPFCSLGEPSENNFTEECGGMPKDSLNEKILDGEKEFAIEYDFYNLTDVKITDHDKGVIYASTTDDAIEKFNGLIERSGEYDKSFVCIGKPIFLNDSLIDIGDKYKVYRDGKMIKDNSLVEAKKKKKKRFGGTLNPNAGNVEHNINMFNHMNNPISGPSTNPSGPMGEAYNKLTVNSYIRDRLNDFYIPEFFSDETKLNIDNLVTDITNIIKTEYPYMLDYIEYWANAEAAEEAGIEEDFYDLIAYENFPEGLIYEYISTLPGFLGETYLTEEFDCRQKIDLEYEDLFITVYGQQRDVDDWDTWEGKVNWTYTVTAQDIIELVLQDRIDESDLPDIDNMEGEEIDKFIDDHFDELYAKYENDILDYFMDDAKEDAEAHYDPRDFDDSADRAYDEYQDRLWDMRESKKTEYNRKDYDDDFDMFLRGI